MYTHIENKRDYGDKIWQADYAFERKDWRTALGYYNACYYYAKENNMNVAYLEMKITDCKKYLLNL